MNGVWEFYDTSDVVCMNQGEHFMATDVEWDPTGRFVATSVSWWAHKVSNAPQRLLKYSRTSTNSHLSTAATEDFSSWPCTDPLCSFWKHSTMAVSQQQAFNCAPELNREVHCSTLRRYRATLVYGTYMGPKICFVTYISDVCYICDKKSHSLNYDLEVNEGIKIQWTDASNISLSSDYRGTADAQCVSFHWNSLRFGPFGYGSQFAFII